MADKRKSRLFGVLDIGTSKVAAAVIVAEAQSGGLPPLVRVAGMGLQRSKGVKAGVLTDIDAAETAVRAAIGQAERAAGVQLEAVHVGVSSGRLKSVHFAAKADVETGIVSARDLERAMAGGRAYAERDGRQLIHMNRLSVRLDGTHGVREPVGLSARHMVLDLHAVTADEAPLRNLLLLIDRCYLACEGLIATPYASGRAAATDEERQLGVTCIDIGAGTTTIGLFADGRFIGADVIPVGSQHITFDIARALQTPLVEAERIKTLYGTLVTAQSDEHESVSYSLASDPDGAACHTTRAELTAIIRPRVAQIISLARERLGQNPASAFAQDRVILTGGGSQLLGSTDYVSQGLGVPVRLARPELLPGLTASLAGPQMSALIGMAHVAAMSDPDLMALADRRATGQGYLGRVGSWIRGSF